MSNPNTGDTVKITTSSETIKGKIMLSTDKNIIIKLDSGYNIGIKKQKIKSIIIEKGYQPKKQKTKKIPIKKDLPTISILHTGGTIASKIDYETGAVIAKFTPEELIGMVPELKDIANIKCKFVANIQSESMRFPHYNLIAKAIEKEIKETKPKGIIITHGTDTLHYTSAALSFILENLSIPIILVGAQRSSDRGSSDSHMNLICATKFIKETDFHGVAICMHNSMNDDKCAILPGTKTRKMHTSRRDAFKPINSEKIALINYDSDKIEMFEKTKPKPKENLKLKLIKEDIKVGILKSHTNIYPENIKHFKNYDGLIIEGTGLGHFQTKSFDKISEIEEKNKKELEKLLKDTIILLSSQCIFGRVNLNVYTPQRELKEIGVMGTEDMTTETAFIKLAWLLSNYKKEEIRKLVTQNLRGEIIKCSNTNSLK